MAGFSCVDWGDTTGSCHFLPAQAIFLIRSMSNLYLSPFARRYSQQLYRARWLVVHSRSPSEHNHFDHMKKIASVETRIRKHSDEETVHRNTPGFDIASYVHQRFPSA